MDGLTASCTACMRARLCAMQRKWWSVFQTTMHATIPHRIASIEVSAETCLKKAHKYSLNMADKNTLKLASGHAMPIFGLGTWKSKPDQVRNAVVEAIQAGYRHIDCASIYGNEEEVGAGLKEKFSDGTVKREDMFITTKLWNTEHHPDDVEAACKQSLEKLGLSYVDLYLMHWPFAFQKGQGVFPKDADGNVMNDAERDFVDTWKGMEKLVEKGLCRAIGVSNFNRSQIQRILDLPPKQKISNLQIEITPYLPGNEILEFCKANDITLTAYSPLGSPDRPLKFGTDPILLEDPVLNEIAKAKGRSPAQIAIRYQIDRGIAVIPKSVTPSRIKENFEVLDFELTSDEVQRINALDRNFRYIVFPAAKNCRYYPF